MAGKIKSWIEHCTITRLPFPRFLELLKFRNARHFPLFFVSNFKLTQPISGIYLGILPISECIQCWLLHFKVRLMFEINRLWVDRRASRPQSFQGSQTTRLSVETSSSTTAAVLSNIELRTLLDHRPTSHVHLPASRRLITHFHNVGCTLNMQCRYVKAINSEALTDTKFYYQ